VEALRNPGISLVIGPLPARYAISIAVSAAEIDAFNHVNNCIYMTWFDRVASDHSAAVGLPVERCLDHSVSAGHSTGRRPSRGRSFAFGSRRSRRYERARFQSPLWGGNRENAGSRHRAAEGGSGAAPAIRITSADYSTRVQMNTVELCLPVIGLLPGPVLINKDLPSMLNWLTWVVPVHAWFHEASMWCVILYPSIE